MHVNHLFVNISLHCTKFAQWEHSARGAKIFTKSISPNPQDFQTSKDSHAYLYVK